MPKFNQPDCFLFDKPADWPEWKQKFRFRTATKLDRETPAVQVSSLVYAMGAFDAYFISKRNVIHERAKLHKLARKPRASTDP